MPTKSGSSCVYDAPGKIQCRQAFTDSVIRLSKYKNRLLSGTILANDVFSDVLPILPYCNHITVFEKDPKAYARKYAFLSLNREVDKKVSLVKADMFHVAAACKFEKATPSYPDDFAWLDFCLHYCPSTALVTEIWLKKKLAPKSSFFVTFAKHTKAAMHGEAFFSITSKPAEIAKDILHWSSPRTAVEVGDIPEGNVYKGKGRSMLCFGYEFH